jgi:hypothetical protein
VALGPSALNFCRERQNLDVLVVEGDQAIEVSSIEDLVQLDDTPYIRV